MIYMPFRKVSKWKNQKIQSSKNDRKSTAIHPHCWNPSPSSPAVFSYRYVYRHAFLRLKMIKSCTHLFWTIFVYFHKHQSFISILNLHSDKHTAIYYINVSYRLIFKSIGYFKMFAIINNAVMTTWRSSYFFRINSQKWMLWLKWNMNCKRPISWHLC